MTNFNSALETCCEYYIHEYECVIICYSEREKKIDITMLKLPKILHITQNENDSEVDKIIKTTDDENKSFALLTCSFCHKITKIKL